MTRRARNAPLADPAQSARAARLRHVQDSRPGFGRRRSGRGFTYLDERGRTIRDPEVRARIDALAIPPAWTEVWICPRPDGHLQATGRDARGRKQYRYHPRWREVRDETKYHRIVEFGEALPAIRAATEKHLALRGLPREKVLATVVRLLEITLIRVGNDEYARQNDSYGLTTLRDKHVVGTGRRVLFQFNGKGGKGHEVEVDDPRLARIVRRCRDLPGYEVFQYLDDEGRKRDVGSEDVNAYLREISGRDFTAKDFRTWAGTVLAAIALHESGPFRSEAERKRRVAEAVKAVAERLRNTPTICRRCYIHPGLLDAYVEGNLEGSLGRWLDRPRKVAGLRGAEAALLRFLREQTAGGRKAD